MPLDFTPSERSVFFASLATRKDTYRHIYESAYTALHSYDIQSNLFKEDNRFEKALGILQRGISLEQATEQQYITNLLNNSILNDFPELHNELASVFGESVDYIKFIEILNRILLGTENYQSIITLEQQRLKELDKAMEKLHQEEIKRRSENQHNVKSLKELERELANELRNVYLQKHGYSNSKTFKGYFSNITPTIDNILADYVQKACNKILQSDEFLKNFITGWALAQANNNLQLVVLNSILNQINNLIPQIVKKVITDKSFTQTSDTIIEELISQASHNIDTIFIEGESIFQRGNFTGIKVIEEKQQKQIITQGDYLTDQLANVYQIVKDGTPLADILATNPNKRKKKITIASLLDDLNERTKKLEEILKEQGENSNDYKELKQNIMRFKQRISRAIHNALDDMLEAQTTEAAKLAITQAIKDCFKESSIRISGPSFSEVITIFLHQIGNNSQSFLSGPKNQKADAITITVLPTEITTSLDNLIDVNSIQNQVSSLVQEEASQFYQDFTNNLHTNKGFSLQSGKESWFSAANKMWTTLNAEITKTAKNEEEQIKKLQQLAKQIKDTIIVTETIKTFNEYNNDIGFVNGTLGSNLDAQLSNIQDLFEAAGARLAWSELSDLRILLVNCSDATLGASNRPALEKFLSSLAAFAVFDEGSAEVEMIANSMVNGYVSTSPQIMHLYKLNGLYYPGSFVLQRIYDNLLENSADISAASQNSDGVQIRATASEALIGEEKGEARWTQVWEKANSSDVTSINVTFLSNLVDIMNQLEAAFNV